MLSERILVLGALFAGLSAVLAGTPTNERPSHYLSEYVDFAIKPVIEASVNRFFYEKSAGGEAQAKAFLGETSGEVAWYDLWRYQTVKDVDVLGPQIYKLLNDEDSAGLMISGPNQGREE